ncbi:mitochondrial genome maintenance protein [Rutstroemia sp. NJR-2017a WRK4]|nr:mitochondrial genome maintenance protein [Rutstroemia sp. NJR-2017a WRK4]
MPPVPPSQGHPGGQSVWNKLQMGAMMGGTVGAILGFMYGAFIFRIVVSTNTDAPQGSLTIIKFGAGPNGIWRTLRTYMLSSGATFGFFMAIGSTIRSDTIATPQTLEAFAHARRRPIVMNREAYRPSKKA